MAGARDSKKTSESWGFTYLRAAFGKVVNMGASFGESPAKIKPWRKRNRIFWCGELQRMVLDIERQATKSPQKEDIALEGMNARDGRKTRTCWI